MPNPTVLEMLTPSAIMTMILVASAMSMSIPDRVVMDDSECDWFNGEIVAVEVHKKDFSTNYVVHVEGERTYGGKYYNIPPIFVEWNGTVSGSQSDYEDLKRGDVLILEDICRTEETWSSIPTLLRGLQIAIFG